MQVEPTKLYSRSWFVAVASGVFLASPIAYLAGLQISSFEFMVSVLTTVLVAWLGLTIYRSRGTFRVRSVLVLMTVAGLIFATVGRNAWKVEQQRLLVDRIKMKGGMVNSFRGRSKPQGDLFLTKGGFALPTWMMPVYARITPKKVHSLKITPEFLTMQNLNLLGVTQRPIHIALLLNGTSGDPAAWSKLCEFSPLEENVRREVTAESLTQADIDFLKSLGHPEQFCLLLKNPTRKDFELLKDIPLVHLRITNLERDPGAAEAISALKSVRIWSFENCQLGQSMESFLGSIPNAQIFSAYQCVITPGAMAKVASLESLEQVGIYQSNFGDAEAMPLAQNGSIQHLSLSGTALTDKSLEAFSAMGGLNQLYVTGAFCTWDGVRALCAKKKLSALMVDSATPPPGSNFQWRYLRDEEIDKEILGNR